MSSGQEAGAVFVKVRPDTTGFAAEASSQIRQQSGAAGPRSARDEVLALAASAGETAKLARARMLVADATRQAADAGAEFNSITRQGDANVRSARGGIGALGVAAVVGYQALQHLGDALRVTGHEAGTLTGQFRNFGAALTSGDLVGAFAALTTEATLSNEQLVALASNADIAGTKLELLATRQQLAAAGFKEIVKQIDGVIAALNERAAAETKADIAAHTSNATRDNGQVAFRGSPDDRGGLRGPGLVEEINAQSSIIGDTEDAIRAKRLENRTLEAAVTRGLQDDLAAARATTAAAKKEVEQTKQGTDARRDALQNLVTAQGQEDSIQSQILSAKKARVDKERDAFRAEIALAQVRLQIQETNARTDGEQAAAIGAERDAAKRLAEDKRLTTQERVGYELQAAQADKQLYDLQQSAADAAARAAEEAARKRKEERDRALEEIRQQRQIAVQTRELRLSNAEARAALTKSTKDDRAAIKQSIAYWRDVISNTKGLQQEQARAELISARARLQSASKAKDTTGSLAPLTRVQDLFKQAGAQFREYGSNITGDRAGVLSGQDARGAYAASLLASGKSVEQQIAQQVAQRDQTKITLAQRQVTLLTEIRNGVRRYGTPAPIAVAIRKANAASKAVAG